MPPHHSGTVLYFTGSCSFYLERLAGGSGGSGMNLPVERFFHGGTQI